MKTIQDIYKRCKIRVEDNNGNKKYFTKIHKDYEAEEESFKNERVNIEEILEDIPDLVEIDCLSICIDKSKIEKKALYDILDKIPVDSEIGDLYFSFYIERESSQSEIDRLNKEIEKFKKSNERAKERKKKANEKKLEKEKLLYERLKEKFELKDNEKN